MPKLKWVWEKIILLISFFKTKYKVTVSFNKEYGDSDDITYITQKNYCTKRKSSKIS